jgi:integrase
MSHATRTSGARLTDAKLRAGRRGDALREGGLEFRYVADGIAGVRFVHRIKGTGQRYAVSLGRYPALGLAEARRRAAEARLQAEQGIDPRHARRVVAEAQQETLRVVVGCYLAAQETSEKTQRDKASAFANALGQLNDMPIRNLTKRHVAEILDGYANRPAQRLKLFRYLSHLVRWCVERDMLPHNFVRDMSPPKGPSSRSRVLTNEEIQALWARGTGTWPTMLKIMLLTGQRGAEVAAMRVEDVDLVSGTWSIPKTVMKQRRAHDVPLSPLALAIIMEAIEARTEGSGPYIFGIGSKGTKPYNGRSNGLKFALRQTGTTGWRGHDCRRTAITILQRLGVPREVRDRVSGHAPPASGAAPYERHDFGREARDAVLRLQDEILRIAQGHSNVVPLHEGRRTR